MTIFVEISKLFLNKTIRTAINDSLEADSSILSTALKLITLPRDVDLGRAKRILLSDLERDLKSFKPEGSDEYSLHEFQKFLRGYKTRLATLAQERQLDEGKTGNTLSKAADLVQSIFFEMEKLDLLDIPRDKELLSVFRYYIVKYFSEKLYREHNLNIVQNLTEHPAVSTVRKRAQERRELIVQGLAQCAEDLDVLDKAHPKYNNAIKRMVTLNIDALLRNEQTLHDKYTTVVDTARQLMITAGIMQDDGDLLNELMQEALREIQLIVQGKDTVNLKEWENPDEENQYKQDARSRMEKEHTLARAELEARETIARNIVNAQEDDTFNSALTDFFKKAGVPRQSQLKETTSQDFDDADDAMITDSSTTNFHHSHS